MTNAELKPSEDKWPVGPTRQFYSAMKKVREAARSFDGLAMHASTPAAPNHATNACHLDWVARAGGP